MLAVLERIAAERDADPAAAPNPLEVAKSVIDEAAAAARLRAANDPVAHYVSLPVAERLEVFSSSYGRRGLVLGCSADQLRALLANPACRGDASLLIDALAEHAHRDAKAAYDAFLRSRDLALIRSLRAEAAAREEREHTETLPDDQTH